MWLRRSALGRWFMLLVRYTLHCRQMLFLINLSGVEKGDGSWLVGVRGWFVSGCSIARSEERSTHALEGSSATGLMLRAASPLSHV